MKTLVVIGLAVALLGIGMPAMAADDNPTAFFALSKVSGENNLQAMTDSQLTAVEGQADFCFVCTNLAFVDQTNVARQTNSRVMSPGAGSQSNRAWQSNSSRIYQRIN